MVARMFALKRSAFGLIAGIAIVLGAPVMAQADEPPAPSVTTLAATNITGTTATFQAKVSPNNTPTTVYFIYGTAPDQLTQRTPDIGVGAGAGEIMHTAPVTGLSVNTKYYVVAFVENDDWEVTGDVVSFATLAPPAILSSSVTDITYKSATLHLIVATQGQPVTLSGCITTARQLGVVFGCNPNKAGAISIGPYSVTADGDVAIPLASLATGAGYGWSMMATNTAGQATSSGMFRTESLIVMSKPTLTPAIATYGSGVTISGTVPNKPGLVVTLAEHVFPFNGPISPPAGTTTATTDATGAYTFDLLAERPAAYGVTADGAAALDAGNVTKLKVAPAVTAKAKRARRHHWFAVAGRYRPSMRSKVSLYRRGVGRVGYVQISKGTFRFPAQALKPGKYEVRVSPATETGFEKGKSAVLRIPRR
jgi:hypothetical protein